MLIKLVSWEDVMDRAIGLFCDIVKVYSYVSLWLK